ncbi:MAG: hypothetical protein IJ035_02740 [Oscillospiraceae bacterium]|nr:hypothetical protein [Oscillospiraceae bacterium]
MEKINVSNAALAVTMLGVLVGIILSIVLYKRKTLNERFVEKCREEGCSARAESVKTRTFYENASHEARNRSSKYFVTYEYTVNGRTYRKTTLEQANNGQGNYDHYRTIYYSRKNPKKARFAKQKSPVGGCLTGFVFAIIVLILAVKFFP